MMEDIVIGADPELFGISAQTGDCVSLHDKLPGTKAKPYPVTYGAIQVDGTAAEINIQPARTAKEFLRNIKEVQGEIQRRLGNGIYLEATPTAKYLPTYYSKLPQSAIEVGCDPDFNAWEDGMQNVPPQITGPRAYGGGHIHVGWTENRNPEDFLHMQVCQNLTRQLDYYLGLASLTWDTDQERARVYGKAGSFRPKSYGLEYRTISNAWLKSSDLIEHVFDLTQLAVKRFREGDFAEDIYGNEAQEILRCGDVTGAREIINGLL